MKIFEVIDKNKKIVYLTKERWSHINQEHPEVVPYFEEFPRILQNPTKITEAPYDENIKYFYQYFKSKKPGYLLIIIKYLNGEGFIITSHFIKNIK